MAEVKDYQLKTYNGIRRGDIAITVEDFSDMGRKKPCLCISKGNEMVKVASFNNKESADYFLDTMRYFIQGYILTGRRIG